MIRIPKGSRLRKTAPGALTIALALGIGFGTASCANDPTVEAQQHAASGDRYAANRQFEEAVIEYGRAIRARPNWGKAHFKRGQAYLEKGDAAKALADHLRAADLDAADGDAQIQAGTLLLLAGQFDAARRYAERATSHSAQSAAAHTLLGNALAGLQQSASAIGEIEQAIELDPAFAPAWTALGSVQLRSGARQQALEAFNRAVALAPASIDARLSLAHYHWATGAVSDAERVLREALGLQPENPTVHRALALFYMTNGRSHEAEAHFTALATNPAGTLALADYYQATGRPARALDVLRSMQDVDDRRDRRAARLKIAAIEYESGQKASAYRIVDELIAEQPKREEPKIAKARLLIRDNDPEQAARYARDALTLNRQSASAHYTLGLAALAVQNLNEAEASFNEVARINPRAGAAQLQLARIHLARGDAKKAAVVAAEAARANPNDVNAAALSVRSLRTAGDRDRAERELDAQLKEHPGSAVLNVEQGWLALQRQQFASASAAFRRALDADPLHREARAGLVATELAGGSVKGARALVENWLAESPSDASLRLLLAQVQLRAGDSGAAERTLRDVVLSTPSAVEAYELLARLYVAAGDLDRAANEYRALHERRPSAPGPLTMIGLIHESQGDRTAAKAQYAAALARDPAAGVAANNLAWLNAEDGQLDEALRLAITARQTLGSRPEVEDTIGWVHFRRGAYREAVQSLRRAVDLAPDRARYHFHLGMALSEAGETASSAAALKQALSLGLSGTEAEQAATALRGHQL